MEKTQEKIKRVNYYGEVFKKYTAFLPLFILAILLTLGYAFERYNILDKLIAADKNLMYLTIAVTAIVFIFCAIYFFARIKSREIYFGDALFLPIFLFLIAYEVYSLLTVISLYKIIFAVALTLLTMILSITRIILFKKPMKTAVIYQSKFGLYLRGVNAKFTFLLPLLFALSAFIAVYYLEKQGLIVKYFNIVKGKNLYFYIAIGVFSAIAIISTVFAYFRKSNFIDVVILSMFYFSFMLLAYNVIYGFVLYKTIVLISISLLSVISLLIRTAVYNPLKD